MASAPRVVLDTNVVVSCLVFGGGDAAVLRRAWQAGLCIPLASTATVQELMRVLAYPKFRLSATDQQELLADYLPHIEVVHMPLLPPATPPCRDAHDVPFLQLAVAGKAKVLVSGDRDVLALAGQLPMPVMTLAGFVQNLSGPGSRA